MAVSSAGVAVPVPGIDTAAGTEGSREYPLALEVAVDEDETERELGPGRDDVDSDGFKEAG